MSLKEVGVEAVVKGLTDFLGSMDKMDASVKKFGSSGGILEGILSSVGSAVKGLASGAIRTLEYAMGDLLSAAIQKVIGELRDLISTALESTTEFQKMEVRLNRLNFNTAISSGEDFTKAMSDATKQTQEQLLWTIKLGAATPFDSKDVANTFTLARSYGFAADEAKTLTERITDFTSGMGLGNDTIEKVITNLGQMKQAGKITGTELRDLARGAFVPINDVLDLTAKNLGITREELDNLRREGKASAESFITAFEQLVEQRFSGAAQDMNKVLAVSTENVREMARSFLSFNIIKPIFEKISSFVADFQQTLSQRFDDIWTTTKRIGQTIVQVLDQIFGGVSGKQFADKLISGLVDFSNWLAIHKGDIVNFFIGIKDAIIGVAQWVANTLIPAFQRIGDWIGENDQLIKDFGKALGEIALDVFDIKLPSGGDILGGILEAVKGFMQYVIDNKKTIADFVVSLRNIALAALAISIAIETLIKIVTAIVGVFLFAVSVFTLVSGILKIVWGGIVLLISILGSPLILAILAVIAQIYIWIFAWNLLKGEFLGVVSAVQQGIQQLVANFTNMVSNVRSAFARGDWVGVGRSIIYGIASGVSSAVYTLVNAAVYAARAAYNAARSALGIRSPSTLFMEIGKFSMEGMAKGIESFAGIAADSMNRAVNSIAMGAMGAMGNVVTTNNNNTNNYNLNIQTSAQTEPIVEDFNMLQSMAGA